MALIHIETTPTGARSYEFIQTWVDGQNNLDERLLTEYHDDRMIAAMTNLGKACRWLSDAGVKNGSVCIATDRDGKDSRFGGEHDDLFNAISNAYDYQRNRAKYALLYGKYVGFLDRIQKLAYDNNIAFTQNDKALTSVIFHGAEFNGKVVDLSIGRKIWKETEIVKIGLSGNNNTVTCNACGKSSIFQQSAAFTPFHTTLTPYRKVKNAKEFIKWFTDRHLELHNR